jgi:hypothetical protein
MWGVEPKFLCRKHLLGEHVEMHMFIGTIKKGISISGYIENGLVNPALIKIRHNQLAKEIKRRGYNHQSPLPMIKPSMLRPFISIDVEANKKELARRCPECLANINKVA